MSTNKAKDPLEPSRVSSEEYRENLEPPDIQTGGSSLFLKSLSEKAVEKPDHLSGRLVREPHGAGKVADVIFWLFVLVILAVPAVAFALHLYYG